MGQLGMDPHEEGEIPDQAQVKDRAKVICPFEILEKIGPNAYKMNLTSEYGVSATFNVADLRPYFEENEDILSLTLNPNQTREDDGTIQENL